MKQKLPLSLAKKTDEYIENIFLPQDDDLDFAIAESKRNNLPPIQITRVFGRILYLFAKSHQPQNILELGTLGGYSTLCLAKALQKNGKIITIEHNEEYAAVARTNFTNAKLEKQIDLRIGEAIHILKQLQNEIHKPFDFVFIDANKEENIEYYKSILPLSRPGTIIICDNVLRNGGVLQEKPEKEYYAKLQEFNLWLAKNPKLESTIIPWTIPMTGRDYLDGVSISIVK